MADMPGGPAEPERGTARAAVWIFVSAAGVTASITVLFLSMRAVMRIGGFCASGGPYVIATPCPKGVAGLMIASVWIGLVLAFVYAFQSVRARAPNFVALLWPALFLSLGYNFLTFAFDPPGDGGGLAGGWLICGVLFVVMGGGPLVAWILSLRHGSEAAAKLPRAAAPQVSPALRFFVGAPGTVGSGDIVNRLERLAELRRKGDITPEEYDAAKATLLANGPTS
jgi:hypothetical protein